MEAMRASQELALKFAESEDYLEVGAKLPILIPQPASVVRFFHLISIIIGPHQVHGFTCSVLGNCCHFNQAKMFVR